MQNFHKSLKIDIIFMSTQMYPLRLSMETGMPQQIHKQSRASSLWQLFISNRISQNTAQHLMEFLRIVFIKIIVPNYMIQHILLV